MKYSDHPDRAAARRRSRRILRNQVEARGGTWTPAGVAADGYAYPEGEWPGTPVGDGRHGRPEKGIATGTHRARRGRAGTPMEGRFLVRDDDGAERTDADFEPEVTP